MIGVAVSVMTISGEFFTSSNERSCNVVNGKVGALVLRFTNAKFIGNG